MRAKGSVDGSMKAGGQEVVQEKTMPEAAI